MCRQKDGPQKVGQVESLTRVLARFNKFSFFHEELKIDLE